MKIAAKLYGNGSVVFFMNLPEHIFLIVHQTTLLTDAMNKFHWNLGCFIIIILVVNTN